MSFLGSLFGNEVSHIGNLFHDFSLKNAEQLLLGAADPAGAKVWGGITGQHFTPLVTKWGGETQAQFAQSDAQGVNTGPSRTMGHVADSIAQAYAMNWAGGAFGSATGLDGSSGGTNWMDMLSKGSSLLSSVGGLAGGAGGGGGGAGSSSGQDKNLGGDLFDHIWGTTPAASQPSQYQEMLSRMYTNPDPFAAQTPTNSYSNQDPNAVVYGGR